MTRESESVLASPGYRLPYAGGGAPAAELAETPLIQARDARIVRQAATIVDGATDPAVAARRLNDWVYREVRKQIVPSVPSAVQVLEAKRGDCNEHTVLYVAMARAAGLAARIAVGVVHLHDAFYYHAWPEVFVKAAPGRGYWLAVDPTLNQFPADPTHIVLARGGLDRQAAILPALGQARIEILSMSRRAGKRKRSFHVGAISGAMPAQRMSRMTRLGAA